MKNEFVNPHVMSGSPAQNPACVEGTTRGYGLSRILRSLRILAALAIAMLTVSRAYAHSQYLSQFNTTYGTSGTVLNTCTLCHASTSTFTVRNAYGNDFAAAGHSFPAIESLDSDGDGWSNIQEIRSLTFPGDPSSFPSGSPGGGTGSDTTRPTVTSFTLPSAFGSLVVPILTFTATDNVGVTGFMVTETATQPSANLAGWLSAPPISYTFASAGSKTLYGWAKDAAGNVSNAVSAATTISLTPPPNAPKSINSTSQNRSGQPAAQVAEVAPTTLAGYQILAANDLGMHCGDLDQRIASILPPFNVLHAQVVQKGHVPVILDQSKVEVVYSAASNPQDPALVNPLPLMIYKTNFWDRNTRTGNPLAFDAFDPYYPAGVLSNFQLSPDVGLPVPDLQRLYFGDGVLAADQQHMPSTTSGYTTRPYSMNIPQPFALFYKKLPFFVKFAFGYALDAINWFSAEGIPAAPFDDSGRPNPYPLMRVQARALQGAISGLAAGTVMASLDVVTPVSGEVDCKNCHTSSADGGNGMATSGIVVATQRDDPMYGRVPQAVSIEYAFDLNILRLHDLRHGTSLVNSTPVSCQKCHYTPALDLAHLGPMDTNGRTQTAHQSFSRVMHSFHGSLGVFPEMPPPTGRTTAVRDSILGQTCYQCHPGRTTQCFRGEMFNAGQACQDCHGNMSQVGNDFSQNVSGTNPGAFIVRGDFYSNPSTPRVPWANEPMCQSCHTGDVNSNLSSSPNVVRNLDGLRLSQAYRTGDATAKPIVAANRRFAENQTPSGQQVLYRLSRGHGGIFCEGCHGSTHAEWPNANANANDNVAATQLQGHTGKIVECSTCHGINTFTDSDFRGNFDANGWMKGPHGMHPVDQSWVERHHDVYEDSRTPQGTCQACHGSNLQGSPLARAAADRTFSIDDGRTRTIAKGTQVSCTLCHESPGRDD